MLDFFLSHSQNQQMNQSLFTEKNKAQNDWIQNMLAKLRAHKHTQVHK